MKQLDGGLILDPCYEEDLAAEVDFNIVMTDRGEYVEVQATAEERPFPREVLDGVLALAESGIRELFAVQQVALKTLG
jgi:ribonuclease PH